MLISISLNSTLEKVYEARSIPQLAVVATDIMEQYKKTGERPSANDFLDGTDIVYEYGNLEGTNHLATKCRFIVYKKVLRLQIVFCQYEISYLNG